jgi:hypothetical protein
METVMSAPDMALESISQGSWDRLVELGNGYKELNQPVLTGASLREVYVRAVQEHDSGPAEGFRLSSPMLLAAVKDATAFGPYEIALRKILAVGIEGKYCAGANWSVAVTAYLKVAGIKLWMTHYKFSSEDSSVTFNPTLQLAKASLTIGIYGEKHCLKISGKACYWWSHWKCADFDESLVCFG